MDEHCLHCSAKLPYIHGAFCPECGEDLSEPPVRPEDVIPLVPPSEEQVRSDHDQAFGAAIGMSVMFYAIMMVTLFLPVGQGKAVEAFGWEPLGLPAVVFAGLLETILFVPLPRGFYHFALIGQQAHRDGRRLFGLHGLLYIVDVEILQPHLAESKWMCLGTLGYSIAVFTLWIVYAMILHI